MKTLIIGCNPSLKNTDPEIPFAGTKSGKTLETWMIALGLKAEDVLMMNLTKFATQNQKKLKKADVNIEQFRFELGVKLLATEFGEEKAFGMIISAYQAEGKLDPSKIVPNPDEQVKADMELIKTMPVPKVITLGKMASWGYQEVMKNKLPFFELPHPSGLNHKLNDPVYVQKTLEECKAFLYSLPQK